jgi:hypothetical protein
VGVSWRRRQAVCSCSVEKWNYLRQGFDIQETERNRVRRQFQYQKRFLHEEWHTPRYVNNRVPYDINDRSSVGKDYSWHFNLGRAFREIKGRLYPAVSFRTSKAGASVSANFGPNNFSYNAWELDTSTPDDSPRALRTASYDRDEIVQVDSEDEDDDW